MISLLSLLWTNCDEELGAKGIARYDALATGNNEETTIKF
jgi:hypothetical protein